MKKLERIGRLKPWHVAALTVFSALLLATLVSLVVFFQLSSVIEKNIREQSALVEGSDRFDKWMHPEYTIKSHMYVYSVRNPDEVLKRTHVPSVRRQGPFVFHQRLRRKLHSAGNGSVAYETFRTYHFSVEDSCAECFLHNRVWIPNLIYQKFVEAASKPAMRAATAALIAQTPFLEVEVAELLFDGYADPFLDQVCAIPFVSFVCESILDLPERIGFFYKKNDSSSGVFEVDDGAADGGASLGRILRWNGKNSTPASWWSSDAARQISGTDGALYKPLIGKDDVLTVFVPELCRSLRLHFSAEVEVEGVGAYRFVVPASDFNFTSPANRGYCNDKSNKRYFHEQPEGCLPDGLLDISRCQKGEPPIVISMNNFLHTPSFVQRSVEGLEAPRAAADQIAVDLEPRLGVILQARRRFQINVAMWRGVNLTMPGLDLSRLRSSVVPVLQIDEHSRIDPANLHDIKSKLIRTEKLVGYGSAAAAVLSLGAAALVLSYALRRVRGLVGVLTSTTRTILQKRRSSSGFLSRKAISPVPTANGGVGQSEC